MPTSDQPLPPITPAELQEIVRVFAGSDLRELRLSVGSVDLVVSRNDQVDSVTRAPTEPVRSAPGQAPTSRDQASEPTAAATPPKVPDGTSEAPTPTAPPGMVELRSPALGTFYRRPAPDKPAFVEVGSQVAVGDSVGTIEVMKMFTAVTADVAGTVAEVCVEDAVLVEHGQPLFYIDPAGS